MPSSGGGGGVNTGTNPKTHPHAHAGSNNNKIWSTSSVEERERIKEFWLGLGEEERRNLVKLEKDTVLKKMKEQQKHSCSCAVCGRKRSVILSFILRSPSSATNDIILTYGLACFFIHVSTFSDAYVGYLNTSSGMAILGGYCFLILIKKKIQKCD